MMLTLPASLTFNDRFILWLKACEQFPRDSSKSLLERIDLGSIGFRDIAELSAGRQLEDSINNLIDEVLGFEKRGNIHGVGLARSVADAMPAEGAGAGAVQLGFDEIGIKLGARHADIQQNVVEAFEEKVLHASAVHNLTRSVLRSVRLFLHAHDLAMTALTTQGDAE